MTHSLYFKGENLYSPQHIFAIFLNQILPNYIGKIRTQLEAHCLSSFVIEYLLLTTTNSFQQENPSSLSFPIFDNAMEIDSSPIPTPTQTPASSPPTHFGILKEKSIEEFANFLCNVVESVTKNPSPLITFVISFFSHPGVSNCSLSLRSLLIFSSLLKKLGRENLILNLFDLKKPQERLACAKLFAFPISTQSLVQFE